MPTPSQLAIDLSAQPVYDFDGMPPTTPARPPSPRSDSGNSTDELADVFTIPAPPPPKESLSAPAAFKRTTYRISSAQPTRPSSARGSALPSRTGSPAWTKATSNWGAYTARGRNPVDLPKTYGGKMERKDPLLGSFGPGMYEVRCSKTGSPKGVAKGTPSFARTAIRDHEMRRMEAMKPGQFGPGLYDIRCFKTGSPKGTAKGTPRMSTTIMSARGDRDRCYEGQVRMKRGIDGATAVNDAPMCSNRGSPFWRNRPSAAFALPHVPRVRRTVC